VALRRIAFGAATLSAARVFQLASSFIAVPFLARMLSPTDFGLVAMAMSVVLFFTYVGDAGLGRSLVRTDATDTEAWSSAFWAIVLLTAGLGLIVLALAWPAAWFFNEPRLVPIMATLALAPVIMGWVDIPAASLLQKEKFQWLAAAEFSAALAGIIVALVVAVNDGGAWALVWQHLTQRIVKGVVVHFASGFRPRLVLNIDKLREHGSFAADTIGWSVMMFVSRQADTLIVGKFLGAATLGLYNVAMRVMQLPVSIFGASLNSAIYPRMVKLNHDNAALRELVLVATAAQAAFVFPPIAAVAAASHAFFTLLLSDRWSHAGEIFTLLAGAAAIQTVIGLNNSLLQAVGRTGARLRITVEFAILWGVAALILAQFGVHAVALGLTVVTALYLPRLLQLYLAPIECSIMDFVRVLAGPALVGAAIFITHRFIIPYHEIDAWPEIGIAALETLVGYALLLWFGRRIITENVKGMRAIFAS
jgi:PST family polysaccharide transporter